MIGVALLYQGLYQEKPKLPFIPGCEVVGFVSQLGQAVRTLQIGDEVSIGTNTVHIGVLFRSYSSLSILDVSIRLDKIQSF